MDVKSLTRIQRRQIALYLHFRNEPISILGLFWFSRRTYSILLIAALLSALLAYWLDDFYLLILVAVAYGTMLLRDVGYYWRSKRVWPVVREVLAWDKVQQLASEAGIGA
jgi:hypothetical protein